MNFLTIDNVRAHCKADSDADTELTAAGEAAEEACVRKLNRYVYVDQTALDAAIADLPAAMAAAKIAYDAALQTAESEEDIELRCMFEKKAEREWFAARLKYDYTINGIVINFSIKGAMLLMAGHLFKNREAVVSGQGATATELPMGVENLLWPYVYVGAV